MGSTLTTLPVEDDEVEDGVDEDDDEVVVAMLLDVDAVAVC